MLSQSCSVFSLQYRYQMGILAGWSNDLYSLNPASTSWTMHTFPRDYLVPFLLDNMGFATTPEGAAYVFGGDSGISGKFGNPKVIIGYALFYCLQRIVLKLS